MSADAVVTLGVVAAVLVMLVWERLAPSAVVLAATVALLVTDVIDAQQAFAGFANPAPITVAALYVLAAAAQKTALLAPMTSRLLGDGRGRTALARLLLPTAAASAFLNNTPLIAMLTPDVVGWARRRDMSASRFLLPLSYASILGGTVTVLGTSTNLLVSGLIQDSGQAPLGVFEISRVGGPAALAGLGVLMLFGSRLVPTRRSAQEQAEQEVREFVVTMAVQEGGALDGRTVEEVLHAHPTRAFLVEISRDGRTTAPVAPDQVLQGGDHLVFVGRADDIIDLQRAPGLRATAQEHLDAVAGPTHTFHEAVVGRTSPLSGRTIRDVAFRTRYQAAVLAIYRDGTRVRQQLGDVRLRAGDTLLVLAGREFVDNWRERRDFLVIARLDDATPHATRQAPVVGIIALAMVLLAAFGVVPILEAALLAAGALIVTGVLTADEIRDAIDFDVVVLIGAAFGLGAAIETTGLAQQVADGFVGAFDGLGTPGIVFGVVLATALLTELATNNAAAVVVFPIAVSVAAATQVDPRAMAMAVAVAASSSFLTPIGYQTNMMVYGPGGYRFTDYLRAGWPMTAAVLTAVTAVTVMG